jgi:hypothetical protein
MHLQLAVAVPRDDTFGTRRSRQRMEFVMNHGLKTILYPITDLAQTKSLYGQLLGADQGRR